MHVFGISPPLIREGRTQIDLIISRNDNMVNMCEIKYYVGDFSVDKDHYRALLHQLCLYIPPCSGVPLLEKPSW